MDKIKIAFDMNDGKSPRKIWFKEKSIIVGPLPEPSIHPPHLMFVGWYTKPSAQDGTRFTSQSIVDRPLTLYAHWANPRTVHSFKTIKQDIWVNDTKNQLSLIPGSEGYDDYIEDLQEIEEDMVADDMHQELAEYNASLASALAEKAVEETDGEQQIKIRSQEKQRIAGEVFETMRNKASKTRSSLDDFIVDKLQTSGSLIHDDGISPDKLDDVIDDIAFG